MKKTFVFLVLHLLLISCSQTKILTEKWAGKTKEELVQKKGPPQRVGSDEIGGEILVYEETGSTSSYEPVWVNGKYEQVWVSGSSNNTMLFYINNKGIIYKVNSESSSNSIPNTKPYINGTGFDYKWEYKWKSK